MGEGRGKKKKRETSWKSRRKLEIFGTRSVEERPRPSAAVRRARSEWEERREIKIRDGIHPDRESVGKPATTGDRGGVRLRKVRGKGSHDKRRCRVSAVKSHSWKLKKR